MNYSNRTITTYPDGSLKVQVEDTRTLEQKLKTLSFAERLELAYPTSDTDVTKDWVEFDGHKRLK